MDDPIKVSRTEDRFIEASSATASEWARLDVRDMRERSPVPGELDGQGWVTDISNRVPIISLLEECSESIDFGSYLVAGCLA